MPRLLKDLQIFDVSGVYKGAGRGVKVMFMKRDNSEESETMSIETIRKAVAAGELSGADVHKALDSEIEKLQRDGESAQQTLSRVTDRRSPRYNKNLEDLFGLDVELGKAGLQQISDDATSRAARSGSGLSPKSVAEATFDGLVDAHAKAHPEIASWSAHHNAVLKTPEGKKALQRDLEKSRRANAA